ncbi:hypothetical protein [Kitasatospora viridis]|uniref:Uncharacterized protein n=1 Tax=Kitasatospora viridis TaxID=281105 RepID=A0A561SFS7_9ACTN|nr:hypothetical protein [Kitasatospora viridis]TWF73709.1 hypothetical protein FHX73_15336 [Kitasatospora viridis]
MSALSTQQSQREALEIALWAQTRQPPPPELLAKLGLLGPDGRALDTSDQETGVGNAYHEDGSGLPALGPLAPFGSWQSVAATILRKTEESAGFDQSSTQFDLFAWVVFASQFQSMPFLVNLVDNTLSASISSLSLGPAIWMVSELLGGLLSSDALTGVINSIKKIGQLAVENKGLQQKNSNVQQGVLTVANGQLRLGLLRTVVQMEYRTGKGYQQLNQQITVSRLFGSLDYDMCIRNAGTLLEWGGRDLDDWLYGTASFPYPPNTSPAWGN